MYKVTLRGVEHPLTFNMGFLRRLNTEYGVDPLNIGTEFTSQQFFNLAYGIIYCGMKTTMSKEEVESMVDEMHPTELTQVVEGMMAWMTVPAKVQGSGKKK